MKTYYFVLYLYILFLFISCGGSSRSYDDFKLSNSLKLYVNEKEYTSLIKKTVKHDSVAFKRLVYYPINDGNIVEHSGIVCRLIKIVGQKNICYWIEGNYIDIDDLSNLMMFSAFHVFTPEERNKFLDKEFKFKCDTSININQ